MGINSLMQRESEAVLGPFLRKRMRLAAWAACAVVPWLMAPAVA